MRPKAIHLYAGTGTMTRAFREQGAEVVLAWEPSPDLAYVYRVNFPDVPLLEEPTGEIDTSRFPEYDVLLANILSPPVSIRARSVETDSMQARNVLAVARQTRPRAVCFSMNDRNGLQSESREQIVRQLRDLGYHVQYGRMDAARFGGVPFKGENTYIIGYRRYMAAQDFIFPEPIECKRAVSEYMDGSAEDFYYRIPEEIRELMISRAAGPGAIYRCDHRKITGDAEAAPQLIKCEICPRLNQRMWYNIYVRDKQGVRRLSWREYLALQGDTETEFPERMANSRILHCLGQHGLYTVEYRIAGRLAGLLLQEWEQGDSHRVPVPVYGTVLYPEQSGGSAAGLEISQAFSIEIFRDSLWREKGRKFLVVAEDQMGLREICADILRLRNACAAHPRTMAEELGIEEKLLRKSILEGDVFRLDHGNREAVQKFRYRERGIGVTVSMWPGSELPELSTVYAVGHIRDEILREIAEEISRPYGDKASAEIIFCGCDGEKLFREKVVRKWPQIRNLVRALWQGNDQKGCFILEEIRKETASVGRALERELCFLYPAECSEEDRRRIWREQRKSLQLLRAVWCLTSRYAGNFGKEWLDRSCRDLAGTAASEREKRLPEAVPGEPGEPEMLSGAFPEASEHVGRDFATSGEQGAFLEKAVVVLLRQLFQLDKEGLAGLEKQAGCVVERLRRQGNGAQGGYDIRVVYRLGIAGSKKVCLFECKFMRSARITVGDIAEKLEDVKTAGEEVEHWILVAPCAKFSNKVASYLENLENRPGGQYPVKDIQVWGEDHNIKELFGLAPDLYHAIYGGSPEDQDAPERWPDSRRELILERWKRKLLPVALLPRGFADYPERPERLLFDVQNDGYVKKHYEELYRHYIRLHYYDSEGRYVEENLEAGLEKWLYQSRQAVKVLLGEFGDGKTFFLYSFCRQLLEKFGENPEERYLPVCFSLKRMGEGRTAAEFIAERMQELGTTREAFLELKRRYHVLVCLDGLDEMTADMDSMTQLRNGKRLMGLCEELRDVKILITSRVQCFEAHHFREMLWETAGEFEVWRLAQIPMKEVVQYRGGGLRERTEGHGEPAMQKGCGILSLAGKPLFLEMLRELWEDGSHLVLSENDIYDRYIEKCLRRKFKLGYDRSDRWVKEEDAVPRIRQALRQIAVRMQENRQERMAVREMESFLEKPLAEILWQEEGRDEVLDEDARNRFSMCSLFKNETGGEISFAHRSIREYFVGMHLLELLDSDREQFYDFLERDICSYEIYGFLAKEISGEGRETRMERLLSLLPRCRAEGSAVAAVILQICFLADVRIPQGEWRGLHLDGVYIPGGDLSGQNLSHSTIRNANLNNVRLDDADCSYCDFTGSRMEETTRVEAIGQSEDGIRVIYADGVVRDWKLRSMDQEICWEEPGGYERAIMLRQGWLALRPSGQWALYGTGNPLGVRLCYRKEEGMTILDLTSESILLTLKTASQSYLTAVVDGGKNAVQAFWKGGCPAMGVFCGENAAVVSDGENIFVWDREAGGNLSYRHRGGKRHCSWKL